MRRNAAPLQPPTYHSFIRRSVYGHGQRWKHAPAPYQSRYNLPPQIQRLPFELLQSHNFPKRPDTWQHGIRQQRSGGQDPSATWFPRNVAWHPYSTPTSSAGALTPAQRLARLQTQALSRMGAKQALNSDEYRALFALKMPSATARMAAEPPGIGVFALPSQPRSSLPPEAVRMRAAMNDPATRFGTPRATVTDPARVAEQVHRAAYFDATPRGGVNVVLRRLMGRR